MKTFSQWLQKKSGASSSSEKERLRKEFVVAVVDFEREAHRARDASFQLRERLMEEALKEVNRGRNSADRT